MKATMALELYGFMHISKYANIPTLQNLTHVRLHCCRENHDLMYFDLFTPGGIITNHLAGLQFVGFGYLHITFIVLKNPIIKSRLNCATNCNIYLF